MQKSLRVFLLVPILLDSLFSYSVGEICYGSVKPDQKLIPSATLENSLMLKERILPTSVYYDKVLGNWIGQMIGNILGLPTEGRFIQAPNPEYAAYYSNVPEGAFTDDDTSMEWVFLHMLEERGLNVTYSQVREEWIEHINQAIWVANARARELMNEGYMPPATGSKEHNENWGAIDAQIECELFGVIHPGMGVKAYETAKWFARVTNDDYAVEAAAFYATMFSHAFFESDVSALVKMAMTEVPETSLTWEVVSDVIEWHRQYLDWRETRRRIWEKYWQYGWVSSSLNLASVVMALLYGNGDFDLSLTIAVAAGWDNDCNAATTGGLLGTIVGESGIHQKWKDPLMNLYRNMNRDNLPSDTISNIASRTQAIAERAILAYGGAILEDGSEEIYLIQTDLPWTEQPANILSDENLARRRSSAPIYYDRPFTPDFPMKLGILNDGVIRNQSSYALRSQNVEDGVWMGYTFGETLSFNKAIYHQGDVSSEGGWRQTLTFQFRDKYGRWLNVTRLRVTSSQDSLTDEGLARYARLAIDFDSVNGTGVRIFGRLVAAGGHMSVAELEVFYGGGDGLTAPARPAGLKATAFDGQKVILEWTDTSDNEHGFVVKRREFWRGTYEEIATLGTNIDKYVDSSAQPFRLYYYVVVAANIVGSSETSNEASVFTLIPVSWNVQSYLLFSVIMVAIVVLALIKMRKLRIRIVHTAS